jgi:hypothetical protein
MYIKRPRNSEHNCKPQPYLMSFVIMTRNEGQFLLSTTVPGVSAEEGMCGLAASAVGPPLRDATDFSLPAKAEDAVAFSLPLPSGAEGVCGLTAKAVRPPLGDVTHHI